MAVRCYNDIAVGGHYLEVPAVAPELRDRRLGSTFAEEQGGVLLALFVVGRQHDPYQLLLAVGSRYPILLHLAKSQLREDVVVLVSQLLDGSG